MSVLLAAAELETLSDESAEVVSALVYEHATVDKTNFRCLIGHVAQAEVAAVLVGRLSEPSGAARTALELLGYLASGTVGGAISVIDEAHAAKIVTWYDSRGNTPTMFRGPGARTAPVGVVVWVCNRGAGAT